MKTETNPSTVTNISSAEHREYLQKHHEREFVLIDVRQSEEYMAGHIPGARLIPLKLALEIELGAYDLYKNLATSVASDVAQRALGELAQQEKGHADLVLQSIGKMAKEIGRIASGSTSPRYWQH